MEGYAGGHLAEARQACASLATAMAACDPALQPSAAASLEEQLALPSLHLEACRTGLAAVLALCEDPAESASLSEALAALDQVGPQYGVGWADGVLHHHLHLVSSH